MTILIEKFDMYIMNRIVLLIVLYYGKNFKLCNKHL